MYGPTQGSAGDCGFRRERAGLGGDNGVRVWPTLFLLAQILLSGCSSQSYAPSRDWSVYDDTPTPQSSAAHPDGNSPATDRHASLDRDRSAADALQEADTGEAKPRRQ